jgi:hypothetical protein
MKILLLYLILLSFSKFTYSQQNLFFPLKNEFQWKEIEKKDDNLLEKFKKEQAEVFSYYFEENEDTSNLRILDTCLHVIDFNYDGLNDIVFDGPNGSEANFIYFFLNKGNSFELLFEGLQGIFKMEMNNHKISKIYIQDWGCCCEYIIRNYIYEFNYETSIPKIELINSFQYLKDTELPISYLEQPIEFKVLQNKYNIRTSTNLNDTTTLFDCGEIVTGNVLGKISSESIGYALSEKTDATGRIWWYVALKPETTIFNSRFYDPEEEAKSFKLGWISSRFVEKL